ncbi:DNA polymerase IV [Caulifigura coniformis]|uniref:DNA polymerase IV n=1 Tax=Caulifigura coniformis TaxID=2527983 RepID=A0A517SLH7_9PLAN|nr:DNA polymerase IV [Caulifigura coniformis]QDT56970.1 DNA polymerase IV [Caulifigura coniformis]
MIQHVDMDAFYASVEMRDRPELRGKPVIVGGTAEGRGVVAAASYEARRFGVHSAMPAGRALKLCPQAIVIKPRMGRYAEVSDQIQNILHRYTPQIEPLSLDEAFLDVTGSISLFGPPEEIARRIKEDIRDELQLVASVGVAPNKFLAKLASDLEKPDALVVVDPVRIQEFLDPLPVSRLWGVGRVTQKEIARMGVETIGEFRRLSQREVEERFGKHGESLWLLAQGVDDRRVVPDREAKSISHETTFAVDLRSREILRGRLLELTDLVGQRLRRQQVVGRTVQLKLRYADFSTITRSTTLAAPTSVTNEIWLAAAELFENKLPARRLEVRLIGVGVQQLSAAGDHPRTLFEDPAHEKQSGADRVSDHIRAKFGKLALRRGATLGEE